MPNDNKINISGNNLLRAVLLFSCIWAILFYGSVLILPLLVSALIATLLDKPTERLKKHGFPSWLAITISITVMSVGLLLLFVLIASEIDAMANDWPMIKQKAMEKYDFFSAWMNQTFQVDPTQFVDSNLDLMAGAQGLFKIFISSLTNLLSQSFIILVYTVLFLMQKQMFMQFFKKLVKNESAGDRILEGSAKIISDYMFGKSLIMIFLFVIYYVGFIIGQVPFAFFLALFAALFSIVPYVGNLIGGGVAIILAYLYSGGASALIVIAVIGVAQVAENYILTPWIIGDKIDLNPFMTIFGVILFSVLWGMVGAIIALPILGGLKVLFEHTHGMDAYAFLLRRHQE